MPLEFFRFPFEIREMVYEALFDTPNHDGIIAPDQHHTRSKSGIKELTDRAITGSTFLQTCQQAYQEAYPFLYKESNVYYFDDVPHSSELVALDPYSRCECFDETSPLHTSGNVHPCKRHSRVPQCDFTAMSDWLKNTGERNRLRIRHIHLHFNGPLFTRSHISDAPPPCIGGEFIDQAFEILYPGHNIETVKISFAQPTEGESVAGTVENWKPIVEAYTNICLYWGMVNGDRDPVAPVSKVKKDQTIKNRASMGKSRLGFDLAFSLSGVRPIKALTVEGGIPPLDPSQTNNGPILGLNGFDWDWWNAKFSTPKKIKRLQEWMVYGYEADHEEVANPCGWSKACVDQYSYLVSGL